MIIVHLSAEAALKAIFYDFLGQPLAIIMFFCVLHFKAVNFFYSLFLPDARSSFNLKYVSKACWPIRLLMSSEPPL